MRNWSLLTAVLVSLAIVGCEGRDTPTPTPDGGTPAQKYALGGSVTGLATGTRVILKTAANDVATVTANGAFAFANKLTSGTAYVVTVQTQPTSPSQTCTVTNGTGTMGTADVTNVQVACAINTFTVGGSVTGLTATGLKLKNNNADELTVASGATSFVFPTKVASGGAYAVTISAQPTGQTCTLSGPSGTVGAGNVTSVTVNCTALTYTVGGNINGLVGTVSLTLTAGSVDETKAFNAAGTFAFTTGLPTGRGYTVTVAAQPATQECTLASATGTMGAANVTSVTVTCAAVSFTVGGSVAGLGSGESVVLALNSTEQEATVAANGDYSFTNPVPKGSAFAVTVKTAPAGKTCSVANGTGTVGANVTNANVTCSSQSYTVGGSVTGLGAGKSVTLSNGGESVTVNQADASQNFTFAAAADGSAYNVQVATQPAGQNCTVTNGSGTLAGANVTNVAVACADVATGPNVVVLRVGNGTAPVSGASAAVSLLQFAAAENAPATTLLNLDPATFSIQYGSGSEGALTRSEDGRFVAFGAYRAPAGTASVQGTTANATRTAVGVNAAGTATFVDFPGTFVGNGIRSATTSDGLNYWASGNAPTSGAGALTGGVWYASTTAPTPVQVTNTPNNARWVSIYGGQLYVSSGSGSNIGVNTVGTGKPTTAAGNATLIPNSGPNGSPHGYAFVDSDNNGTMDVLYVTSDNAAPAADTINLVKLKNVSGTWTLVAGFAPALAGDAAGTRSVAAARAADGTINVFVVTGAFTAGANNNKLVFFTDDGVSTTPAVKVIATAETNYNFRGVALAPTP